jgi:hypothetical protein
MRRNALRLLSPYRMHLAALQLMRATRALEVIRKLAVALGVSADTLVYDEHERGPDDDLRLQFEALSQFTPEEKAIVRVLESLILKHDANRFARNSS